MISVISQISEGLQNTGAVFPVRIPEIPFALPDTHSLFLRIIPHIDTGIPDGIIPQKLRIQRHPQGRCVRFIQRNSWIIKIGHRSGRIPDIMKNNLDPFPSICPENQRFRPIYAGSLGTVFFCSLFVPNGSWHQKRNAAAAS